MLRLYDSTLSGNSWKVRILLNQLEIPFERITLDLSANATNDPTFRKKSRFARVPVLELHDGRTIVESGAILLYLAEDTALLPSDTFLRAEIFSWLFFEQADLQRAIAIPRVYHLRGLVEQMSQRIAHFQSNGYPSLEKLNNWLNGRDWLVAERYSVADIGVFAYVSMASEGGYHMDQYSHINAWISRFKSRPRWIPLLSP